MGRRLHVRMLLVEGDDDRRVFPWLVAAHGIEWGSREDPIVLIKSFGGIDPLLKPGTIEMELKTPELEALGIIVDANDGADRRWIRIRDRCIKAFSGLPDTLPEEGLIVTNADGLKLGVWRMPDNRSRGMLETFLAFLVPTAAQPLWQFANETATNAKTHGADFKDAHEDKARVHTWLAWQDPPGRQLHDALHHKVLKPGSSQAQPFIAWFQTLFGVQPRQD